MYHYVHATSTSFSVNWIKWVYTAFKTYSYNCIKKIIGDMYIQLLSSEYYKQLTKNNADFIRVVTL